MWDSYWNVNCDDCHDDHGLHFSTSISIWSDEFTLMPTWYHVHMCVYLNWYENDNKKWKYNKNQLAYLSLFLLCLFLWIDDLQQHWFLHIIFCSVRFNIKLFFKSRNNFHEVTEPLSPETEGCKHLKGYLIRIIIKHNQTSVVVHQ